MHPLTRNSREYSVRLNISNTTSKLDHSKVHNINVFNLFTIFTDHKPIIPALHKKTEPTSARQARQLAAIAEATSDIRHVDGKSNLVADALSRPDDLTKPTKLEIVSDTDQDLQMQPLVNIPMDIVKNRIPYCPNNSLFLYKA